MAVSIPALCADLSVETDVLLTVLAALDESAWNTPTPSPGWTIKDQVAHLAFFDAAETMAVTDAEEFRRLRREATDIAAFVEAQATQVRQRTGADVLADFRSTRAAMLEALHAADPAQRVPWYGPNMSLASAVSARIMETWAHGQDVFDALGIIHPTTPAVRQVADIGVRAFANSFTANGRDVPSTPVRVQLDCGAEQWHWGPDTAIEAVIGDATDFCLVVTQRRHVDDTTLVTVGDTATAWIGIAQAFAGPPGRGRGPGEFGSATRSV